MEGKRVLIVCADGCEDLEIVAQIDVLTRGGISFTVASANGKNSRSSFFNLQENKLFIFVNSSRFDPQMCLGFNTFSP